jgi:hypothetical protein
MLQRDLKNIVIGQKVTASLSKQAMTRLLPSGEAITVFDTSGS